MNVSNFIFPHLVSVFTFTDGFFFCDEFLIGYSILLSLDFPLKDFSGHHSLLFIGCILVLCGVLPQIQCCLILRWYVLVWAPSLLVRQSAQSLPMLRDAGLCRPALSSLWFHDRQCFEFLLPL
jgi:hypothetical protein